MPIKCFQKGFCLYHSVRVQCLNVLTLLNSFQKLYFLGWKKNILIMWESPKQRERDIFKCIHIGVDWAVSVVKIRVKVTEPSQTFHNRCLIFRDVLQCTVRACVLRITRRLMCTWFKPLFSVRLNFSAIIDNKALAESSLSHFKKMIGQPLNRL